MKPSSELRLASMELPGGHNSRHPHTRAALLRHVGRQRVALALDAVQLPHGLLPAGRAQGSTGQQGREGDEDVHGSVQLAGADGGWPARHRQAQRKLC